MAQLAGGLKTIESDMENLLRTADQNLYLAKSKGGDQICAADEISPLENSLLSKSESQ